jgi:preprotein translocase subunit SecG
MKIEANNIKPFTYSLVILFVAILLLNVCEKTRRSEKTGQKKEKKKKRRKKETI